MLERGLGRGLRPATTRGSSSARPGRRGARWGRSGGSAATVGSRPSGGPGRSGPPGAGRLPRSGWSCVGLSQSPPTPQRREWSHDADDDPRHRPPPLPLPAARRPLHPGGGRGRRLGRRLGRTLPVRRLERPRRRRPRAPDPARLPRHAGPRRRPAAGPRRPGGRVAGASARTSRRCWRPTAWPRGSTTATSAVRRSPQRSPTSTAGTSWCTAPTSPGPPGRSGRSATPRPPTCTPPRTAGARPCTPRACAPPRSRSARTPRRPTGCSPGSVATPGGDRGRLRRPSVTTATVQRPA